MHTSKSDDSRRIFKAGSRRRATQARPPLSAGGAAYHLALAVISLTAPDIDAYPGFDLSSSNDPNLPSSLTLSAVAGVPQPVSASLLSIGAVGLLERRNRRNHTTRA